MFVVLWGLAGSEQIMEGSSQERNEVTCPTRLNLKFLQPETGSRSPVVSTVIAGKHATAFLTRAPEEFPDIHSIQLVARSAAAALLAL